MSFPFQLSTSLYTTRPTLATTPLGDEREETKDGALEVSVGDGHQFTNWRFLVVFINQMSDPGSIWTFREG
jgi:hypothetical protein